MKLITELNEDVKVIAEEREGKKKFFIEGIFLQSAIANKNKRIYPEHVMDKEAARYIQENINKNKAYGELGHPSGPTINLERSSHMIRSLVKEGKNYIGRAEVLETPMGNIVRNLLEAGANLGVSSRGLGSLKPISGGLNEVMDDFHLATAADIVADPSAPGAFVKGIMEGVEFYYDNGILKEREIEEIRNTIKRAPSRRLEEAKLAAFHKFMRIVAENR
jgi:hypothetical protein